jgi:hypothetical protein
MEINYTKYGDYHIPDIRLSESLSDIIKPLGKYGQLRQKFLKEHCTITYNILLLKEKLYPHLRDVDSIARERHQRGVPEEIILSELIYE